MRVAIIGNVDSGKSTMVGVLTRSMLDDGRGLARSKVGAWGGDMLVGVTWWKWCRSQSTKQCGAHDQAGAGLAPASAPASGLLASSLPQCSPPVCKYQAQAAPPQPVNPPPSFPQVFKHHHEESTGRTSSIGQHNLCLDSHGGILNDGMFRNQTCGDYISRASKVVTLVDLAGHEKYFRWVVGVVEQVVRGWDGVSTLSAVTQQVKYFRSVVDGGSGLVVC